MHRSRSQAGKSDSFKSDPDLISRKIWTKSRDHFLTRAFSHLNLFEVPMPEPPLTWCFPAEFLGFFGDLAKNAFDTSEATGFVGA